MKSFDILIDVVSDTWLKSQFPRAPSHTKERAIGGAGGTGTDGTRITQRKIHRGKTGLRRADKEGRGDEIDKVSASTQRDQTNFLRSGEEWRECGVD